MNNATKISLVIVCSVVVTSLTLKASDYVRFPGMQSASVGQSGATLCSDGMVLLNVESGTLCVDAYEASPAPGCPATVVQNETDTQTNISNSECATLTAPDVTPWRYVSHAQAKQLCARSDKRLPSVAEWYDIALTLSDDSGCVISQGGVALTGTETCVSRAGVYDIVGNVWEWVSGQVVDGTYEEQSIPASGYVAEVDTVGIVTKTANVPQEEYGYDYAQTNTQGVFGIVRGGYYGSRDDAGVYAQNLAVPFDIKTAGIGFRCVQRL